MLIDRRQMIFYISCFGFLYFLCSPVSRFTSFFGGESVPFLLDDICHLVIMMNYYVLC